MLAGTWISSEAIRLPEATESGDNEDVMATGIAWRSQVMSPLSKCQLYLQASGTHPADGEVPHSLRLNFPPSWRRSHIQFNLRKVEFLCLSLWTKFLPLLYTWCHSSKTGVVNFIFYQSRKKNWKRLGNEAQVFLSYVAESKLEPNPCSWCQNACFPEPNRRVLQDVNACCKNII